MDVLYADAALSLTMRATSLRDASMGERLSVRLADGRLIEVTVAGPGKAILR